MAMTLKMISEEDSNGHFDYLKKINMFVQVYEVSLKGFIFIKGAEKLYLIFSTTRINNIL